MWFLVVITVASAVFADPHYLHNAPNRPFDLSSNQPSYNYPLHDFQRYHYNNEEETRSNAYLKKYNMPNNNGFGNPSHVTGHANNGYTGYNQLFTPLIPINNNYAQGNFQHAVSPLGVGGNVGYIQAHPLPTNGNRNLNSGATYSNSYAQPSIDLNQNSGYTQTLTAPGNNNYNNGYSQSYAQLAPIAQQNIYSQPFIPIGGNDVKSNFVNTATIAGAYNNGPAEGLKPVASVSSSNGYNQDAQNIGYSNNAYSQSATSSVGINVNSGYTRSFTPSFNANNGYTETASFSTSNQLNSGYGQTLAPPLGAAVSNRYEQSFAIPSSTNLKTGYEETSISSGINVTPIIHKHIYFHVPPPEIEEARKTISASLLPKKNYKILFIKVPSQESKSNLIRLQEQIRNSAIEDKTLIYVLVKKPEEPKSVVLSEPKPSDHQVYFVKYNDSPFDIAARVNEELDKTGSINSIVPLESGLVNG